MDGVPISDASQSWSYFQRSASRCWKPSDPKQRPTPLPRRHNIAMVLQCFLMHMRIQLKVVHVLTSTEQTVRGDGEPGVVRNQPTDDFIRGDGLLLRFRCGDIEWGGTCLNSAQQLRCAPCYALHADYLRGGKRRKPYCLTDAYVAHRTCLHA